MRFCRASLAAALALCLSGSAMALDVNDVSLLLRNRVGETVIMNIVREQGLAAPPTAQDILRLNADGASSELLELLTRAAPAARPAETAAVSPVVPPPVVVAAPPQVVYCPPAVPSYPIYAYPPSYYYRPRPGPRFHYGFGFSFGGGGHHRHGHGRR